MRASRTGGRGPQFTTFQPTVTQGGRGSGNAPIYTALDLSHIFGGGGQAPSAIHVQRQLQGQARAKAAVARGLVKPRVIAQDPTTGQHHDITPQNMVRPEAPQTRDVPELAHAWPWRVRCRLAGDAWCSCRSELAGYALGREDSARHDARAVAAAVARRRPRRRTRSARASPWAAIRPSRGTSRRLAGS